MSLFEGTETGLTARNAVVRLGVYVASAAVNLAVMPFVLRRVGIEAFGIIGVMNTLVAFMSIVTVAITGAVGRETVRALRAGGAAEAGTVIGTALTGLVVILGVLAVPGLLLARSVDVMFVVPPELRREAQTFAGLALGGFGVTAIAGPLGAVAFARNRVDLMSLTALARTIAFAVFVVILFSMARPNLVSYGAAVLASAATALLLSLWTARTLLPEARLLAGVVDREALLKLLSLGGWMIVIQAGALLFLQTDLVVANRVLGPAAAGKLGALALVSVQVRAVAGMLTELLTPSQVALAFSGDRKAFGDYLLRSVRLTTLVMALIVGVFCGSAAQVLGVWLGKDFEAMAPVAVVMTAYLVPTLGLMPCWNALVAIGDVRVPALVTLGMGAGNVLLGILLAGPAGLGLMGIAIAGCISLGLRNTLWAPWYVSVKCGVRLKALGSELIRGTTAGAAVFVVTHLLFAAFRPASIWGVGLALAAAGGISVGIVAVSAGRKVLGALRGAFSASRAIGSSE